MLLPILILNTDGQVAFDNLAGIYYTQVDAQGRGSRVFRHQVGQPHETDLLVYDESRTQDFAVSVENTLSKKFLQINIRSTFEPSCNEVWLRGVGDFESKFWLVQPMEAGVTYYVKHAGSFLYKLSNEEDRLTYKLTKIPLPTELSSR